MTAPRGYPAQEAASWAILVDRGVEGVSAKELVELLELSKSRANDILADLHRRGHVQRVGRPFRYVVDLNSGTPVVPPADR